jgi:serine/threonine protein kinase
MMSVHVTTSRSGVFLIFEYAQHDLATLIDNHYKEHKCSPFRESEVKRLMLQLLTALNFLHSRHILHRDLKLSNLLYNHRGELRVADFGLARRVGGDHVGDKWDASSKSCLTPKVVSLWYRPPELLFGGEFYDMGVDNWGAGCTMGELLLGRPLMSGKDEMDQLQKMFDFLGPPNVEDWPGLNHMPLLKNGSIEIPKRWHIQSGQHMFDIFRSWRSTSGIKLLSGLLKYNPKDRWTADEALAANYFSELPAPTPLSLMPTFPTKHS